MNNSGISLIEVLVAVLILSIGLLGMAGLQMRSLSNHHNAYLRTQATQIADDMLDRIRSNQQGLNAGSYFIQNPGDNVTDCHANVCNAAQMAGYDLSLWNKNLAVQLPNGKGALCLDSTPQTPDCDGVGSMLALTLSWSERENGSSVTKAFTTSFQP